MMNISMKGTGISLTDAIKDHAKSKLSILEKVIHHPAYASMEMGKPSHHHKGGTDVFETEITIDTNGHTYFVKTTGSDLYRSIDQAVSEMAEVIKQGKGKRQTLVRKGRMALKQLTRRSF